MHVFTTDTPLTAGTTQFCVEVTDGAGLFTTACATITMEPDPVPTCRCAPYT
jgi:hypothetical protein